jgi:predicted PurR-regulated permease PerM
MRKILRVLLIAILFYWALHNISGILAFLGHVIDLLIPFIIGIGVVVVVNIPMKFLERKVVKIRKPGLRRALSLVLSLILMVGVVGLVLFIVIPELGSAISSLIQTLPAFLEGAMAYMMGLLQRLPNADVLIERAELNWETLSTTLVGFITGASSAIMNSGVSIFSSLVTGIINFFVGFIFAIYVLFHKEKLGRQMRMLMYAYMPTGTVDRILRIADLTNTTFAKFLTSQTMEAGILGSMFLVSMTIFRFPYALVISLLVTVTALIPIVGSFIALGIGFLLILVTDPIKALWFVGLFLVLQQTEGDIIYPKVVGNAIGLPAIWVLAAVIIGGDLMGILGMFLGVPIASVAYVLLKETVRERLVLREVDEERVSENKPV